MHKKIFFYPSSSSMCAIILFFICSPHLSCFFIVNFFAKVVIDCDSPCFGVGFFHWHSHLLPSFEDTLLLHHSDIPFCWYPSWKIYLRDPHDLKLTVARILLAKKVVLESFSLLLSFLSNIVYFLHFFNEDKHTSWIYKIICFESIFSLVSSRER